jgi:malonate transporter
MALMIAEALVPIFFVIFLGYFPGARRIIDNQNLASLNVLLVTYAAPTALFVGVAQISRSGLEENGKLVLVLVISMLVIFGITFALNHCVFRLSPTPISSSVSVPARKCCVLLGTSRRRVR